MKIESKIEKFLNESAVGIYEILIASGINKESATYITHKINIDSQKIKGKELKDRIKGRISDVYDGDIEKLVSKIWDEI